jgi:hypothetical protein
VVERKRQAVDGALDRRLPQLRAPVEREMASPLGDQHAFVARKVEGRVTRLVPPVVGAASGKAKVEHVEARSRWDVA